MSYITASGRAFGGLGSTEYYAPSSSLKWTSKSFRDAHNALVSMDALWQKILDVLPSSLDIGVVRAAVATAGVDVDKLKKDLDKLSDYPLPGISEIAFLLELTAGQRPLQEVGTAVMALARDRCIGAAGITGVVAAVLAVTGIVISVSTLGLDIGISAATLGGIATALGFASAGFGATGAVLAKLAKGEPPSCNDMAAMASAAGSATGTSISETQAKDACKAVNTALATAKKFGFGSGRNFIREVAMGTALLKFGGRPQFAKLTKNEVLKRVVAAGDNAPLSGLGDSGYVAIGIDKDLLAVLKLWDKAGSPRSIPGIVKALKPGMKEVPGWTSVAATFVKEAKEKAGKVGGAVDGVNPAIVIGGLTAIGIGILVLRRRRRS